MLEYILVFNCSRILTITSEVLRIIKKVKGKKLLLVLKASFRTYLKKIGTLSLLKLSIIEEEKNKEVSKYYLGTNQENILVFLPSLILNTEKYININFCYLI